MNIEEFNSKFINQGGYPQLRKMIFDDNATYKQIAIHFGINNSGSIRWILKQIFDEIPDSRLESRHRKINALLDFMKQHPEKEVRKTFRRNNKEYYREALFFAYQQQIYVSKQNSVQPMANPTDPKEKTPNNNQF